MSEASQIALINSIPPTIAALLALVVGIVGLRRGNKRNDNLNQQTEHIDAVLTQQTKQLETKLILQSDQIAEKMVDKTAEVHVKVEDQINELREELQKANSRILALSSFVMRNHADIAPQQTNPNNPG